jgi:L-ascorbate metabolism protein UlaG (beta-lactamase superfamily)
MIEAPGVIRTMEAMDINLYTLSDTTVVEPLVNCWPAWSFVVAPGPASLHLANYQIKALESYLADPEGHVKASSDPMLIGGPFVDIAQEHYDAVAAHLADTKTTQGDNLAFAAAFRDFQNQLVTDGKGQSLESYYERIPPPLRGYVELVYDYYNRASVRLLEGLLYESKFYKPELQSVRIATLESDRARPFFISTPRIPIGDALCLQQGFASDAIANLFRLDSTPQPLADVASLLGVNESDAARLVAPYIPRPDREWSGEGVRVRYIGHACVLLQSQGVAVLTDPCVGSRPTCGGVDRFSFSDLPSHIDFALVTHNHQDHFYLETLLRLRHRIGTLVVPKSYGLLIGDISLRTLARKIGFRNVVEVDALDSIPFDNGELVAIPFLGEHADLGHGKAGYVVRFGSESFFFGADSDCLDVEVYRNVRNSLGAIHTAFLGTECVGAPLSWTYGSLFPKKPARQHEQTRRYHGCNAAAATRILEALGATRLYNYAMGMEPWTSHILGLNLTEDSAQIQESNLLLQGARERNFAEVARLFGKVEMVVFQGGTRITGNNTPQQAVSAV